MVHTILLQQPQLSWGLMYENDSDFSSPSLNNSLMLPWYEKGSGSAIFPEPAVIDTSRSTKIVIGKACKAFGINVAGFEHELFDIILRMEERRQLQLKQKDMSNSGKKSSKKKGETEIKRLKCGLNYDKVVKKDRGRHLKAFSE